MNDNPYLAPDKVGQSPAWNFALLRRWGARILIGVFAFGVLLALLLPTTSNHPGATRRTHCKNNLLNIAKAIQLYHDCNGGFPPPYTVDRAGNRLHSWRTLILPYIEQQQLYDKIDLTKPWNDPANKRAFDTEISVFRCPTAKLPKGHTTYLALVGEDALFNPNRRRCESDIKDGLYRTLMLVEAPEQQSVHWMEPTDADEQLLIAIFRDRKVPHGTGVHVAFADCGLHFLTRGLDAATLHAMVTIDGNDQRDTDSLFGH